MAADPWTFRPAGRPWRGAFHVPYVGYAFEALSIPWVAILATALPALGIGLSLLTRRREVERLRRSSSVMLEAVLRLRGRLAAAPDE